MKKFLLLLAFVGLGLITCGQSTRVFNQNLTLKIATPTLLFDGNGGIINFNSDVNIVQSANTLTLNGGNLALGANSLTMTGSLALLVWVN